MKESRHSTERIISILKEADAGMSVAEVCRKYGISDATYCDWKEKYGGMTSAGTKRLSIWRMRAVGVRTL